MTDLEKMQFRIDLLNKEAGLARMLGLKFGDILTVIGKKVPGIGKPVYRAGQSMLKWGAKETPFISKSTLNIGRQVLGISRGEYGKYGLTAQKVKTPKWLKKFSQQLKNIKQRIGQLRPEKIPEPEIEPEVVESGWWQNLPLKYKLLIGGVGATGIGGLGLGAYYGIKHAQPQQPRQYYY